MNANPNFTPDPAGTRTPGIDPRRHRPGCTLPPPVVTTTATGAYRVSSCPSCGAVDVAEVQP